MGGGASAAVDRGPRRALTWLAGLAVPAVVAGLVLAVPRLDRMWQHNVTHFWLVGGVAAVCAGVAVGVGRDARRRRDARLYLVALAFVAAAGFLGLHALATPAVVLAGPNGGFEAAVPVGLFVASLFCAASAGELSAARADWVLRHARALAGAVALVLVAWGAMSLLELPPLREPIDPGERNALLDSAALAGTAAYVYAGVRFWGLHQRRQAVVIAALVGALVLLAEVLAIGTVARNWRVSWWEWHVLLVGAFGLVYVTARRQSYAEGESAGVFDALSLEETVEAVRADYGAALEALVDAIEGTGTAGRDVDELTVAAVAADVGRRFDLTERQVAVLRRSAELYRQVEGLFRSYLPAPVASELLSDPTQAQLGGELRELSVLMADLRSYTAWSERMEPDQVLAMLNTYYGTVVPVILGHGGTVVQFVGDAVMALFNAPVAHADHAARAARTGLAFQAALADRYAAHPDWPRFRVGVNTGPAVVGNIGSDELRNFTAIGDTVNLAARLESLAPEGAVVIGHRTYEQLGAAAVIDPLGPVAVKGKAEPVTAYVLKSLGEPGADPGGEPVTADRPQR